MDFLELWSEYRPQWSSLTYVEVVLIVFLLSLLIYRKTQGNKWGKNRILITFILLFYIVMVFSSTVFSRESTPGLHYCLELFWSYKWGIKVYGFEMIKEIVLNILMLIPVGVLMPICIFLEKKALQLTITVGILCSVSIESLQFILKCGLAEIDDIIHNTLGVLIGYGVYKMISVVNVKIKQIRKGVSE